MSHSKLHRFDQRLCRDVLDNIMARLDSDAFRAHFRTHLKKPVRQYFQAIDGDNPPPALLLNDQELDDLALAFEGESVEIDRPWVPYTELYRSHIDCVSEIRERLAPAYAQEWSEVSERLAAELSEGRIRLRDGIELVHEWVSEIRRLLRAMGLTALLPYPEGAFPTPTCPQPQVPCALKTSSLSSASLNHIPHAQSEAEGKSGRQKACESEHKTLPPELSRREAASYLGISVDTLLQLQRAGLLRYRNASPPGSGKPRYRYPVADLDRFMQQGYHRDQAKPNTATSRQRKQAQSQAYEHLDLD